LLHDVGRRTKNITHRAKKRDTARKMPFFVLLDVQRIDERNDRGFSWPVKNNGWPTRSHGHAPAHDAPLIDKSILLIVIVRCTLKAFMQYNKRNRSG